ncbi:hypothetical protein APHAL10511_006601 [Amanita phalloides]|nr:hypothetical protein APHAL10511_006601 [Amanita phalloides]
MVIVWFLGPCTCIRPVHLEPAFALGCTDEYLPPSIAHQNEDEDEDWAFYYVNIFVAHDMFMRYHGGGVGHTATRKVMEAFLSDRHSEELKDIHAVDDLAEVEGEGEAQNAVGQEELQEAEELDYGYHNDTNGAEEIAGEEENHSSNLEAGDEGDGGEPSFAQL